MQLKNTIKIEFLISCPGKQKYYREGKIYEVEEETAKKYIKTEYAKPIKNEYGIK